MKECYKGGAEIVKWRGGGNFQFDGGGGRGGYLTTKGMTQIERREIEIKTLIHFVIFILGLLIATYRDPLYIFGSETSL